MVVFVDSAKKAICDLAGLMLRVPKFSKYLHGVASLYPNRIESIPYWFLPADKEGYVMTPASWEEMADPKDPHLKVSQQKPQPYLAYVCSLW